jgi:hypothetical protein
MLAMFFVHKLHTLKYLTIGFIVSTKKKKRIEGKKRKEIKRKGKSAKKMKEMGFEGNLRYLLPFKLYGKFVMIQSLIGKCFEDVDKVICRRKSKQTVVS